MKNERIKPYLDLLLKIALSILLLTITFWIFLGGEIHVYHHFEYQVPGSRIISEGIRLEIDAAVNANNCNDCSHNHINSEMDDAIDAYEQSKRGSWSQ